ncbi:MAG: D-alanyl-D-alanine carboxypeptidase family protein, partial [Clostridia bacterium]
MKKIISVLLCAVMLVFSAAAEESDNNTGGAANNEVGFSANSPYVLFMDMNTGRVMYEKNADEKIYPASTVKIMTAILALENCNLEDKAAASETALASVPDGVTVMDIMPGETLTVRQLLYGAMLASAADATNVLAEAVSGSIGNFVQLMNKKAKELGMENTNFSNTHGEHDDRTYTTVRDMAVLTRYAMQNQDFREIVKTDQYTIQPTEKYKEVRNLVNTNYMVSRVKRGDYYYSNAIGVKAGYTAEARSCLVEVAKSNNMELLALTFGSESVDGKAQGYIDCKNFFTTAFENYKTRILVKKGTLLDQLPVKNAKRANQILLEAAEDLYYIYPIGEEEIQPTVEIRMDEY